ncbi:MAG: sulfotransferase [Candidatus Thermoplasmatota archaeon]|nr:sulfotransferase [Candidatus Thermoplasmatota archaeon]
MDVKFIRTGSGSIPLLNIQLHPDKPTLVSSEELTRHNFVDRSEASMATIADRIHKVFPEARIILTLRNKEDWLQSLYKHYQRDWDGRLPYNRWLVEIFDDDDLQFERYVEHLRDLFPEVLVLRYEKLQQEPEAFVEDICNFIGVELPNFDVVWENVSFPDRQLNFLRSLEKLGLPNVVVEVVYRFFKFGLNQERG